MVDNEGSQAREMAMRRTMILVVVAMLLSQFSGAQFQPLGEKLIARDALGNRGSQGDSVALSADGSTLVMGGHGDNSDAGAAWVFTRAGGAWTQQARLVGRCRRRSLAGVVGRHFRRRRDRDRRWIP